MTSLYLPKLSKIIQYVTKWVRVQKAPLLNCEKELLWMKKLLL